MEENRHLKETIEQFKHHMANSVNMAMPTIHNSISHNNESEIKSATKRRGRPKKSPQTTTKSNQRKLKKKKRPKKDPKAMMLRRVPMIISILVMALPTAKLTTRNLLYGVTNPNLINSQPFANALFAQPKAMSGNSNSNMALTDLRRVNSSGTPNNTNGVNFPRMEQRMVSQSGPTYSPSAGSNLIKLNTGQTITCAQYCQLLQGQQIKPDAAANTSVNTSSNNGSTNGMVLNGGLDNHAYLMPWSRIPSHGNTGGNSDTNGSEPNNNGPTAVSNTTTNSTGSNNSNASQSLIFPHFMPQQVVIQLQQKKAQAQQAHSSSVGASTTSTPSQTSTGQQQQANGQPHTNGTSHTTATPIYLPHNYHQLLLQQQYPNAQLVLPAGNQPYNPQQGQQVAFMQFQQS
ncbi:hypothetical protein RFI_10184 [Reticulomyxa filosa]|uniref:Uncharacterized protein n=1 Tax=Reticulomyxa filosa TaxID=46433 RepID=X6NMP3_RETFI|nr:hypothetical protein RFI_10184 [Reticulomyxa filosa]|eukprot:ETO26949.1 hypothetical protein RFI_10184 [Reticulomyxa filosa]